jgi:hypothetical protein
MAVRVALQTLAAVAVVVQTLSAHRHLVQRVLLVALVQHHQYQAQALLTLVVAAAAVKRLLAARVGQVVVARGEIHNQHHLVVRE